MLRVKMIIAQELTRYKSEQYDEGVDVVDEGTSKDGNAGNEAAYNHQRPETELVGYGTDDWA